MQWFNEDSWPSCLILKYSIDKLNRQIEWNIKFKLSTLIHICAYTVLLLIIIIPHLHKVNVTIKDSPTIHVDKQLRTSYLEPLGQPQATLASVYVPPPITPVTGNCGQDYYQQLIYQRESGCNTASVNSIGCAGLGQACPGSKLPCSLDDWTCQNNFFTGYMLAVYGSWQAGWQHELQFGWW